MNEIQGARVAVMRAAYKAQLGVFETLLTEVLGPDHEVVANVRKTHAEVLETHDQHVQCGLATPDALRGLVERWENRFQINQSDKPALPKSKIDTLTKFSGTLEFQRVRISAEEEGQLYALNPRAEITHRLSEGIGRHYSEKPLPAFVGTWTATTRKLAYIRNAVPQFGHIARAVRAAGNRGVRDIRNTAKQAVRR